MNRRFCKKCRPPIDLILQTFRKRESVSVAVNQAAIQGSIVSIERRARVLILRDVSGSYFVPFDNIDYIQSCGSGTSKSHGRNIRDVDETSTNTAAKVSSLHKSRKHGCDPSGAVAIADASGGFQ